MKAFASVKMQVFEVYVINITSLTPKHCIGEKCHGV